MVSEDRRFLLAVQWWSRPLSVPRGGDWGEISPNTCFLDPVPTSGALEDTGEEVCRLLRHDGCKVQELWGLFNNSHARRQIASIIKQHVSLVLFATVDGRIEWTGQTKSACKENPVPSATTAALFHLLRQRKAPLPPSLLPLSFSIQEAYNRFLTTNSESRDQQRAMQAAARQKSLHGGELPAFFKGNYFPAPELRRLPSLDEEALPPVPTLIATEGLSALSAVLGSRDALPGMAGRTMGLVGLQGFSFFFSSFLLLTPL